MQWLMNVPYIVKKELQSKQLFGIQGCQARKLRLELIDLVYNAVVFWALACRAVRWNCWVIETRGINVRTI